MWFITKLRHKKFGCWCISIQQKPNKENPAKHEDKAIIPTHLFICCNGNTLFQFPRVISFALSFRYTLTFWKSASPLSLSLYLLLICFWLCWVFAAVRVFLYSYGEWGLPCICGVQASHCDGFSCCKARAVGASASAVVAPRIYSTGSTVVTHGPWDLPGPGLKLMSPALAGGFFTTEPPGKLQSLSLYWLVTHTQSFLICCSTLPTTNPIPPETLWISLLGNARITLDSLYP